eukprot:9263662-Pyramimonas_sp.AAC.2
MAALLAGGADTDEVDAQDHEGRTALHRAVMIKDDQPRRDAAVRALLAASARASVADNAGNTPLHLAALCGRWTTVELLLEEGGADADAQDHSGKTALHLAAAQVTHVLARVAVDRTH